MEVRLFYQNPFLREVSMNQDFLTVDELADRLKVQKSWLYYRTRETGPDAIPRIKVGKYLRFRFEEVIHWLEGEQDKK